MMTTNNACGEGLPPLIWGQTLGAQGMPGGATVPPSNAIAYAPITDAFTGVADVNAALNKAEELLERNAELLGNTQTVSSAASSTTNNTPFVSVELPLAASSTLTDDFPGSFSSSGNDLVFTAPADGYYRATANVLATSTVQVAPTADVTKVLTVDAFGPTGQRYRLYQSSGFVPANTFVGYSIFQGGSGATPAIPLAAGQTITFNADSLHASDGEFLVNLGDSVFSVSIVK